MAENQISTGFTIILIGGSAGSLEVILTLLRDLKTNRFPIVIVLHRKNTPDSSLVNVLSFQAGLPVKEAEEKEVLQPGHVYLAPADYHLLFEKDHSVSLDDSEKVHYSRPSIDVTFQSAADIFGAGVVGILLSGGNSDGADGLKMIKQKGGICLVQHPDSAEVSFMPQQAVSEVEIDRLVHASEIAGFINSL